MKKVLYLIILLCLIFGTNNYKDLGQLAIITNIGIEKKDNDYIVTFQEIMPSLSNNKVDKKYNYYRNRSSDLVHAFNSLADDITKDIYLEHLENIIIKTEDKKVIKELDKVMRNDLDNFNIILSDSNLKKVMSYRNNYKYVNTVIKDNITLRTIKKNKLEKKSTKIPIVKLENNRLLFYKYIRLGEQYE